jgi:ssDNA-binding Zn-finger/Zn-ribbon topoisomerase 1
MTRASLGKDYGFCFRSELGTASTSKWDLQRAAKRMLPENGRFHACNHNPKKRAHGVAVYTKAEGAWFSGVYQCGSVWICPICARRIAELRRHELQTAVDNAIKRAWGVALVTLTFPHGAGDVLADILEKFTDAQSDFKSGRAAASVRSGIEYVGEIRTLEVTHGSNGFHPHTHSIWVTEKQLTKADAEALESQLFDLWLSACLKRGLPPPNREHGVDVRVARHDIAEYIGKWGFAAEMAGTVSKRGKNGSRNPWQLLADAADGEKDAARLWRIFADAFFGKRQLFWSKRKTGRKVTRPVYVKGELTGCRVKVGTKVVDEWISLREELKLAPELTDQALLDVDEKETDRQLVVLDLDTWHVLMKSERQAEVLHYAVHDRQAMFGLLNHLRQTIPMEDGRMCGPREDWEQ